MIEKKDSIAKYTLRGLPDESWKRLEDSLFKIIDKISNKVSSSSYLSEESKVATSDIINDITKITSKWAKAKLDKPSLENERIKAEIAEKFASTKKLLAETEKTEEEINSLRIDNRHKELMYHVEELELFFNLMNKLKDVKTYFHIDDNEANLFIGDVFNKKLDSPQSEDNESGSQELPKKEK
ncbi:MAG: hypothetical protein ACTSWK_16960 [Promethearchaeota archaeon]